MSVCGGQPSIQASPPSRQDHMPLVEPLVPEGYRCISWKNGRGELVVIDSEGPKLAGHGVAWHFGRTAIIEEGSFSDYTGYERLQVVTKGGSRTHCTRSRDRPAPAHASPALRRRHAGPHPARNGPVEVVNLIANRARFQYRPARRQSRHRGFLWAWTARRFLHLWARRALRSADATTRSPSIMGCACALIQGQMSRCRLARSLSARSTASLEAMSSQP